MAVNFNVIERGKIQRVILTACMNDAPIPTVTQQEDGRWRVEFQDEVTKHTGMDLQAVVNRIHADLSKFLWDLSSDILWKVQMTLEGGAILVAIREEEP